MSTETSPRFSFRPIECLAGLSGTADLARRLAVGADEIPAMRRDGLTVEQAEAMASAFATTPAALWPAWTALQNIARASRLPQAGSAPRLYSFDEVTRHLGTTSVQSLADQLRLCKDAVRRMIARGLTHDQAEEIAVRIGTLPEQLWPEWLDHHVETSVAAERRTAERGDNGGKMSTMTVRTGTARNWSSEQVVQAVRRCATDLGKTSIGLRDYMGWVKTQECAPGHSTVFKILGSWRQAVAAAGLACAGDAAAPAKQPAAAPAGSSDDERQSIHRILMTTKPSPLTVAEVATRTGIPARTAAKHVKSLYTEGAVQAVQGANGEMRYCAVAGR